MATSQDKPSLLKLPLVNLATATRKVTTTGMGSRKTGELVKGQSEILLTVYQARKSCA